MPPESSATTRPLTPVGMPPGPGFLPEVVERFAGERLDVDRELRIVEVDGPSLRFLDAPADLALDLRRRERKSLVGALRRHAERGDAQIAEILENGLRDAVDVERHERGARKIRDAEDVAQPLGHRLPRVRRRRA